MSGPVDILKSVLNWTVGLAEDVLDFFDDEAAFKLLAADAGLDPKIKPPEAAVRNVRDTLVLVKAEAFIVANQDNFEDIASALNALDNLLANLEALIDAVKDEDAGRSNAEFLHLIFQLMLTQRIRRDAPLAYAAGTLGGAIAEANEALPQFDPSKTFSFSADDEAGAINYSRIVTLLTTLIGEFLGWRVLSTSNYGWDLSPTMPPDQITTPNADSLLRRAFTVRFGEGVALSLTLLFVTRAHGGPGVVLNLGGEVDGSLVLPSILREDGTEAPGEDALRYDVRISTGGGAALYIPFGGSATERTRFDGQAQPTVDFSVARAPAFDGPIAKVGSKDSFELALGEISAKSKITKEAIGAEVTFKKNKISIADKWLGDGFLADMSGGKSVDLKFDFGVGVDSKRGFYLTGDSGLKTNLPLASKRAGPFRIDSLALAIKGSKIEGMDGVAAFTGLFGFELGPFEVSVEELGLTLDVGFSSPPEDGVDYPGILLEAGGGRFGLAVKPPIGLLVRIKSGVVEGGGYLRIDSENSEYSGVFELKFMKSDVRLSAAAILTTDIEGGSSWAFLLIISGEFPPIQLSFGFTLKGAGGIIGLQHSADREKLQDGLRTGAMDQVLFPSTPLKGAPGLINTLRTVFPVTPRAFTIGPTVLLGWGTPTLITAKLGILLGWNNFFGNRFRDAELAQLVLLGQLEVNSPSKDKDEGEAAKKKKPELLRLLVDVLGSYDFNEGRLSIDARLRNSHIAKLGVKGSLAVRANFGGDPDEATPDQQISGPRMLLAVGGLNPNFEDVPPDVPKQDKVAFALKRGPLTATCEIYVAITSSTFQAGFNIDVKVKAGPVKVHAYVTFDVLAEFDPFKVIFDFDIGASVKFKGKTLAGVTVKGKFVGPGRTEISGRGKVKVSIFKKSFSFCRVWGDDPEAVAREVAVGALLRAALSDATNWTAELPRGRANLVSLQRTNDDALVLHPAGQLVVRQTVVPLGLNIDTFGQARPSDGTRFDVKLLAPDPTSAPVTTPVTDYFARGRFRRDIGDRLRAPSFETFDAGIAIGSRNFATVDTGEAVTADYETLYLDEPDPVQPDGAASGRTAARPDLAAVLAQWSEVAQADPGLTADAPPRFKLLPHAYTFLEPGTLASSEVAAFGTFAQAADEAALKGAQVAFRSDYEVAV